MTDTNSSSDPFHYTTLSGVFMFAWVVASLLILILGALIEANLVMGLGLIMAVCAPIVAVTCVVVAVWADWPTTYKSWIEQ